MQQSISTILALAIAMLVISILSLAANLAFLEGNGDVDTVVTFYWIALGYLISVVFTALVFAMSEKSTGRPLNYVWASLSVIGLVFVFAQLPDAHDEEYKAHRSEFEEYMRKRHAGHDDASKEESS